MTASCDDQEQVEVAIIGNGPSGIFLSYILSGHNPYYDSEVHGPHPDSTLDQLLNKYVYRGAGSPSLLDAVSDTELLDYVSSRYASFYSSNMLAVDLLVDTLVAADETEFASNSACKKSRILWKQCKQVSHKVLGNSPHAGGQWTNINETDGPEDMSLSYAEMLSLPEYSYSEFFEEKYHTRLKDYSRPTRRDVSDYYAEYPKRVGIESNFMFNVTVTCVDEAKDNCSSFNVTYVNHKTGTTTSLRASNVVLASGVSDRPNYKHSSASQDFGQLAKIISSADDKHFLNTHTVVPPLATPPCEDPCTHGPCSTLIIGSGVSAAEAINKCQKGSSVIHIFKWDPKNNPCPLRRYPKELYPEYASVYNLIVKTVREAKAKKHCTMTEQEDNRDYEGLVNAKVIEITPDGMVDIELENGDIIHRRVSKIKLRTGRSGCLDYVCPRVLNHINEDAGDNEYLSHITKNTIRDELDGFSSNLKITDKVYAIGSLSGDTLVRFMLGGCMLVAQQLMSP
ncbi:hypothetical protein TRICI_000646 [Trichomonascus ciferrii]|uniref:Uncharacterized protein n=1 Tax=Trichomonascus ciferrii TaxID=44093 RepID=A0A642VCV9_9ASCO|nr:hypothetical protein TRICI_000646 [Trichomonascus ciferrii]